MGQEPTCQHCGAALPPNTYFCGECGKAAAAPPGGVPKSTILGAPALAAPDVARPRTFETGRTTAAGVAQPPRGAMGRTMLGIPLSPPPPPPEAPSAEPTGGTAGGAPSKAMAKTMLGMPVAAIPEPTPPSASEASSDPRHARTLIGANEPLRPAEPSRASSAGAGSANARTMMGLENDAPLADDVAGETAAPVSARSSRGSGSNERSSSSRGSRPSTGSGRVSTRGSVPGARRAPSKGALVLAVLALLAALVLGYLAMRPAPGPDARVRVVSQEGQESMEFEVPGAQSGTKLRFGGQEKPLQAGRASFLLGPDSLRVGKNVVPYDLVAPSGEVTSGRISLDVDYRVTLDTGPLRAGKAAVDVVVAAVPGSQVWLDGQSVALDAHGRAVRSDPLEPSGTSGRIEHVVRYRVQPPSGEPSVGELRTVIPVTMMQIDKPGVQVTTDRDAVEIAGAVDKDARVTIDGQAVPVSDGRFLHRYALPQPGEYRPEVIAAAPGKAPNALQLAVTRVPDLAEAAKDFAFDPSLTYAKIAQNPAIYRGQRVALEGRVYNVNVESGRSALQMLVRECPSGQRCSLWVGYHAATEFTVDSWVRVLGTVEGEQQFRSETDEVKVVPKVEATFLLPARP